MIWFLLACGDESDLKGTQQQRLRLKMKKWSLWEKSQRLGIIS